jgi:hypothetical protein
MVIRAYRESDLAAIRRSIVELQDFERQIDDRLRPGESMATDCLAEMIKQCRVQASSDQPQRRQ